MEIDFKDLENENDFLPPSEEGKQVAKYFDHSAEFAPEAPKQTYTCERCKGRGSITIGYVNIRQVRCMRCNGTGQQKAKPKDQSPEGKARRAKGAEARRLKKQAAWKAANDAAGDALVRFLNDSAPWSPFANSLAEQLASGRALTDAQLASARSMMEKCAAKKAAAAIGKEVTAELSGLRAKFESAHRNGIKTPVMRVGSLTISRAKDTSTNPGFLYVKRDGEYSGKISPQGSFVGRDDQAREELNEIAGDVLAAAVAYGRRTGKCSCCGRELTKGESIDLGIGPICADKWGM